MCSSLPTTLGCQVITLMCCRSPDAVSQRNASSKSMQALGLHDHSQVCSPGEPRSSKEPGPPASGFKAIRPPETGLEASAPPARSAARVPVWPASICCSNSRSASSASCPRAASSCLMVSMPSPERSTATRTLARLRSMVSWMPLDLAEVGGHLEVELLGELGHLGLRRGSS